MGPLTTKEVVKIIMKWVLPCVPDLMWLREASIRSMKEAGTVIVFLVSSNMSSFRVMTFEEEKKKCVRRREEERFKNPSRNSSLAAVFSNYPMSFRFCLVHAKEIHLKKNLKTCLFIFRKWVFFDVVDWAGRQLAVWKLSAGILSSNTIIH